jgi:predicted site-specific integrase-resolvase
MKRIYEIKDWMEYLGASRATVSRYIKSGLIPKPDHVTPRPRWNNNPMLTGLQSNQNNTAS